MNLPVRLKWSLFVSFILIVIAWLNIYFFFHSPVGYPKDPTNLALTGFVILLLGEIAGAYSFFQLSGQVAEKGRIRDFIILFLVTVGVGVGVIAGFLYVIYFYLYLIALGLS